MLFISLSLCYLYLVATLGFLLSIGLVVWNEFYPNTFRLSATSANILFAAAGCFLIVLVAASACYVMFFLVPHIGGGINAL